MLEDDLIENTETVVSAIIAQNWSDALLTGFNFLIEYDEPLTEAQKSMIMRVAMLQHHLCSNEIHEFLALESKLNSDIKRIQDADNIDELLGE